MEFLPAELIKKKRRGYSHSQAELKFLIDNYVSGEIPDYQMSAWLMASFLNGLSLEETANLTDIMKHSGRVIEFNNLKHKAIDKHSTGGVGDKLSLILGPIAAACGVPVPMIAGRGLGHTGGTLDKLEAIPGFSIDISIDDFVDRIGQSNIAIIGQTDEICPADKKIYALRDVTATVESLPLICASIMSKKLAEGISGLVLDVKWGSGAFMKTVEDAEALANLLCDTGVENNIDVTALITDMNQPLGQYIGNALEIVETNAILKNESDDFVNLDRVQDSRQLSLHLAANMVLLSGLANDFDSALSQCEKALEDGSAWKKWQELIQKQGGDLEKLPHAPQCYVILSPKKGYLESFNTEKIGLSSINLGAGRLKTTDEIDMVAGIKCHKKIGDFVEKEEPIFTIYSSDISRFENTEKMLLDCFTLSEEKVKPNELIVKTIRKQRK